MDPMLISHFNKNDMAKFLTFILFLLIGILPPNAFGQEEKEGSNHGVFLELLGNGIFYSVNYDTRFSKKVDGLGGKVGFGYISIDGDHYSSFPFLVNYLIGKNGHYFEMGAGANFLVADFDNGVGVFDKPEIAKWEGWSGTISLGYRYHPVDGGFLFRAGFTPIVKRGEFNPFWPQVSFGYAF
jgi:hypothetical protein